MLFSAYRRDDFADAEGFVAQLGTVLSEFSDDVVRYVTSPQTGIQRRSKWPPTISEVLEACEQHQDHLRRLAETRPAIANRLAAPSTLQRPQGYLANIFVHEEHPRYASLVEWTKEADPKFWKFGTSKTDSRAGLWVSNEKWMGGSAR